MKNGKKYNCLSCLFSNYIIEYFCLQISISTFFYGLYLSRFHYNLDFTAKHPQQYPQF